MANGAKVKGPGGLGQWDLGTATQDIRAPIRNKGSSSGGGGGGDFIGSPSQVMQHLYDTGQVRRPSRGKGRGSTRNKRK